MKKLVVLTGAGISKESGLSTFREQDGLWENHAIEDVATPEAWSKNPKLVTAFYNARRKQLFKAKPNAAHLALKTLEENFEVEIITQNVDDLHEQAGSTKVLHLHGKLKEVRSVVDPKEIYTISKWEVTEKDVCTHGQPLRPNIVWFGEDVPMMPKAAKIAQKADYFVVIGTSLQVYPAAHLLFDVPPTTPIFVIDPQPVNLMGLPKHRVQHIQAPATKGVASLQNLLFG